MTFTYLWCCSAMNEREVLVTALGGRSSRGCEGFGPFGPQPLYAAYGKIHIKDRNLIRLERAAEQICHGGGRELSSVCVETEG